MESTTVPVRERIDRFRELSTLSLVLGGAAIIPLAAVPDAADAFRLVKDAVLRGEAILLVAVTLVALLFGAAIPPLFKRDRLLLAPVAAVALIAVLTLLSTKPNLSASALATAAATLVVFLATVDVATRHGWLLIALPLASAVINATLVVLEETGAWMPFGEQPGIAHHLQCTALVGNPNEVGSYLGAAALLAVAVLAGARERRVTLLSTAMILGTGLLAARTLTAFIAFGAAAFAMLALTSWRSALRVAIAGVVAALIVMTVMPPFRERATHMAHALRNGDYNAVVTDRLTPFVAAWSMFVDHPITGTGPGTFAWQYFDYKLLAESRFPLLRRAYNRGVNYGEVHDDHLQVLAEGGLAGYTAFAALLILLARVSLAIPRDVADDRRRFARFAALPLAVFWVVLSLAQFPLETTVVRSLLVHIAALAVAWRSE